MYLLDGFKPEVLSYCEENFNAVTLLHTPHSRNKGYDRILVVSNYEEERDRDKHVEEKGGGVGGERIISETDLERALREVLGVVSTLHIGLLRPETQIQTGLIAAQRLLETAQTRM